MFVLLHSASRRRSFSTRWRESAFHPPRGRGTACTSSRCAFVCYPTFRLRRSEEASYASFSRAALALLLLLNLALKPGNRAQAKAGASPDAADNADEPDEKVVERGCSLLERQVDRLDVVLEEDACKDELVS